MPPAKPLFQRGDTPELCSEISQTAELGLRRKRSDGTSPVEEFIDGLSDKQAAKVAWVMRLIEDLDRIPSRYWKKLKSTDDIWEARIQFWGNIFRILGFEHVGKFIILTNGFAKKTQKTPQGEIALAEQRKKQYLKENDQ